MTNRNLKSLVLLLASLSLLFANGAARAFDLGGIKLPGIDKNQQKDLDKIFGTVKKAKKATGNISESEEVELGKKAAAVLLGAAPLVKNQALQLYVNRVGHWVAMQTERPGLPWRFGVLDTDSVNAFATPGGYVFVTNGLLQRLDNEAELAGVLAHEISHVLRRHHLEAIKKNAAIGLTGDIISMGANEKGTKSTKKIFNGLSELYARGLDKDYEFEADSMGTVIATRAGYDSYGLMAVLLKLESMNPADGSLALMFKTHPSPTARIEKLDKLMSRHMTSGGNAAVGQQRFMQHVAEPK